MLNGLLFTVYCFADYCFSCCPFYFGHCVSILRFTTSDYPFGRSLVFCVVFRRSMFVFMSPVSSPGQVSYCNHFASVVRRPSVNISHFNLLLRNHWANCNQTLVEWSLDGPLPQFCPLIPTSNQGGRQAKNRKKGDEILIVHCCFSISQNELKF
jgi:hypothetical protein